MTLTEFLSPKNIQQGIAISSKKRALELIGKMVADHLNDHFQYQQEQEICPVECFANLFKREKLGSTGINHGVALPHAKLPSNAKLTIEKPIAVFLQLDQPIDFEASDNKEVDLIYAILFPENCCHTYKHYLPKIAQKLSDKSLLKLLRTAESVDDIWQILDNAEILNEGE